jgi:hypothetical protein
MRVSQVETEQGYEVFEIGARSRERAIKIDNELYVVDSNPDVDLIGTLVEIEETLSKAEPGIPTVKAAQRGKHILISLLREWNPGMPENISMNPDEVYMLCTFITQGKGAAETVREALTAAAALAEVEVDEESEVSAPVPLRSRSNGKSSRSGKRTSGGRTTGKTSRSASGGSNSSKQRGA